MLASGVRRFRLDDAVEQLDLIDGGLSVMGGGADDLQRDVFARGGIPRQPHGREMTPSQLAHYHVTTIVVSFAHRDRVVATLAVILGVFFLSGGFDIVARGGGGRSRSGRSHSFSIRWCGAGSGG